MEYEHFFINAGVYSCGSVFGLGEQMHQRSIVAKNLVQCLVIPRYWLLQKSQNSGNIWLRYFIIKTEFHLFILYLF